MQSARSVSHSGKTLRWYLSFRPVAVLAAAFAALLTTGLVAGSFAGAAGAVVVGPHATAVTSGTYVPLTPARISDTRAASGFPNAGATLTAGGSENVVVEGAGGVPTSGVSAVVLNVAATNVTAAGFLTVFPEGGTQPTVANLNTTPGNTVSNLVTVAVGTTGGVTIFNHAGTTDVVVDVEGYYTTSVGTTGLYDAVTPDRVFGTLAAGTPIPAGTSAAVTVTGGSTGVPADARAVVFNLTASAGTAASFLTAYPAGSTQPTAANLNFGANQIIGNRVTVPVGTGGQVEIFNHAGTANVDVDLDGYYTGSASESGASFVPITPTRLVDTRTSTGGTAIAQNTTEAFSFAADSVIPANASALASNVTVVAGNAPGFLTIYPTTVATPPTAADVNWTAGGIVPNFAIAPLNGSSVNLFNNNGGAVNVVIDAFGYFAPVTIPTFTVTPSTPQSAQFAPTQTSTVGDVAYTASGFTAGQLVNIALFPSNAATGAPSISTTTGAPTFLPNGSGLATGQGTTNDAPVLGACVALVAPNCTGYIASVNGVPELAASASALNVAANASGSVTFVVNANVVDSTIPVVFTGPSTNLAVNINGTPATGFEVGIGGSTTWGPPTPNATSGTYTHYLVQTVNTAAQTFTACSVPGPAFAATNCNTFSFASANADTFNYYEPNAAGSTTLSGANFSAWLTGELPAFDAGGVVPFVPGDTLTITYSTIGPSNFTFVGPVGPAYTVTAGLNGNTPSSPTAVNTSVNGAGNVVVNWTAPPQPDVLSYTVLRATVPASGVVTPGLFGLVVETGNPVAGTPTALPGGGIGMLGANAVPPATTFTDTTVTPGTVYEYEVIATGDAPNNGSASAPSLPSAQVTPPATPSAAFAPLSVSTGFAEGNSSDVVGQLQAGDTFTVNFNTAVSVSPTFSLNVTDGIDTAVLNQTNSTLTLASPTQVIYTVTNNSIPGVPGVLQFTATTVPLQVTAQSGVSDSVGPWNLAGSAATNGPYVIAFGAVNNTTAPVAPAITQPVTAVGTTTVAIGTCITGDTVTLYTENGSALGSATCAAAAASITTSATVFPNTVLIANQTAGGVAYTSRSAVTVGFSPLAIATTGTLTAAQAVNVTTTSLPGLTFAFSLTTTNGATATINTAALGAETFPSTGQLTVVYTSGPAAGATTDSINTTNSAAPASLAVDTYTY
jgi:hypothetical protein